jgi:CBS domain-containing protein
MSSNNTSLESVSVSSIMITDVRTAEENQGIQAACKTMYENKMGSIVILKNPIYENKESKIPIGIVTERDIVRLIALSDKSLLVDEPVHAFMKTPLITINPNSSITDAIETMQQKDIRRLPVVDNKGKMLGIITDKDIFRTILKNQALASSGVSDQILVDQQSIYGKFTDYWFRDVLHTP